MRILALLRTVLVCLALVGATGAALAQTTDAVGAIDAARKDLDRIEQRLTDANLGDDELDALRARVEPMAVSLESAIALLQPQLAAAKARLDQIGDKPKDGDPPESADVTRERDQQTAARQEVDENIKRGRLLQVESQQVATQIAERRRALLAERLTVLSRSLLEPRLWLDVAREAPRDIAALRGLGAEWSDQIVRNQDARDYLLVGGALVLALLLLFPIRRLLQNFGEQLVVRQAPQSRLRRSSVALLRLLASTLAPALAAFALYWALKQAGWVPARAESLVLATVWASGFLGFTHGMMKALLAPGRPSWRLIELSDAAIAEIKNQPMWVAGVFVAGRLLFRFNEAIGASLPATIATTGLFAVLNVVTYAIALRRIRAARRVEAAENTEGKEEKLSGPVVFLVRLVMWAAMATVLVSAVTGYSALAQFLANQVVWATAVVCLAYLLLILVDDVFVTGLSSEVKFGRKLSEGIGVRASSLEQFGVLLSGVARLILLGVAALFILAPWGLQSTDVFGWLRYAVTGVQFGDIRVSLPGLFGSIALVALGFALTRFVQRWLDRDLLPKTRMDDGLKASVNTGVGYVGVMLVILFAVSNLGFSLDRLAIVAGALSVGIGFGLQAVISNFVSGVILLAERPIKAGDWIVIGSDQGNVKRISVRSTEIELFDRSTLIVPNSDFITKSVKNVTHGAPNGRIHIQLGVSAAVDPVEVKRVTLETVKAHSTVLVFPEPQLLFTELGKDENRFSLYCNVPSPRQAASVKSDLNFALIKAFAASGVALGGPAAPDMALAVERVAAALGGLDLSARSGETAEPHDASDAPPEAAETPQPAGAR